MIHDGCVLAAGVFDVVDVKAGIRAGRVVDSLDAIATRSVDSELVTGAAGCSAVDVKAGIRAGRVVDSFDALAGARQTRVHHVVDVKAQIRGGRVVDSFDALDGDRQADAFVRHAAALQLIDVKAHVLGGLA